MKRGKEYRADNHTHYFERECEGYLIFPKRINGKIRWLCHARWIEEYPDIWLREEKNNYWKPIKWL